MLHQIYFNCRYRWSPPSLFYDPGPPVRTSFVFTFGPTKLPRRVSTNRQFQVHFSVTCLRHSLSTTERHLFHPDRRSNEAASRRQNKKRDIHQTDLLFILTDLIYERICWHYFVTFDQSIFRLPSCPIFQNELELKLRKLFERCICFSALFCRSCRFTRPLRFHFAIHVSIICDFTIFHCQFDFSS